MSSGETDLVKEQVAAHWGRRAPGFDDGFGHSIRTPAERAAWDRIFDLVLTGSQPLDALDAGCGTGFLSFELAAREHRRRKAAEYQVAVRFEEADAERLPFPPHSFDLAISRHVLWTLPHPEAAIDEWIRVLRSGGRLVVIDGQFDPGFLVEPSQNARTSAEYAAIGDRLPFLGGRPREEIEAMFQAHGLVGVGSDPVLDLVEAQAQRMVEEGGERQTRRRYVIWGDVPR